MPRGARSAAAQKRGPPPKMTRQQRAEATARIDAEIAAGKRPPRTKEKIQDPYVVVDWNRHVGIVIHRAVDYVYHIGHNGKYLFINRSQVTYFDKVYKPLHLSGDLPYPVQKASRKFLEWASYTGATDAAKRVLSNLALNKELDMSNVEKDTAAQTEAATPVPAEKAVKEAAEKAAKGGATKNGTTAAAKGGATKNGTTAAAKRPSRAKAGDPATVQAIQDAAKKATSTTKSATADTTQTKEKAVKTTKTPAKKTTSAKPAKKTSSAKPAAAAKKSAKPAAAAKKSAKKTADAAGRAPSIPDDYVISKVVDNPKREGTEAYTKFSKYKVGMTVGQVLAKNVDRADMNYNVKRGFVSVKKPSK